MESTLGLGYDSQGKNTLIITGAKMPTLFRDVAGVAIEEIIRKHVTNSKYGFFLSEDALKELVADMFEFVETSRSLKSAGDRYLADRSVESSEKSAPAKTSPRPGGGLNR